MIPRLPHHVNNPWSNTEIKESLYYICQSQLPRFISGIEIDGQFHNWNCLFKKLELIKLELKFAAKKNPQINLPFNFFISSMPILLEIWTIWSRYSKYVLAVDIWSIYSWSKRIGKMELINLMWKLTTWNWPIFLQLVTYNT